jgi:hypothetical protein
MVGVTYLHVRESLKAHFDVQCFNVTHLKKL